MINLNSVRIILSENNELDSDSVIFFLINVSKTKQYPWFYYKEQSVIICTEDLICQLWLFT